MKFGFKRTLSTSLSLLLLSCQPGSTPVHTQTPKTNNRLPHPANDQFSLKITWQDNFAGYCEAVGTENASFPPPGANNCYNSGGTPEYASLYAKDEFCYAKQNCGCLAYTGCRHFDGSVTPHNNNSSDNHEPLDLLVQPANKPPSAKSIPGDSPQQRATFSPGDSNDAFDWVDLVVYDDDNQGWSLTITNPNGRTVFEDSGSGSSTLEWGGENQKDKAGGDGTYTVSLIGNGQTLTRELKIDNKAPKIARIKTKANQTTNRLEVEVKITDAGNSPTGIDASSIRLIADSPTPFTQENTSYEEATGIWKTEIIGLAAYEAAKQLNPQYEQPFELEVKDYVWNTSSSRESGEDGPLRLRVDDPYFSPNDDGAKDKVTVQVIDEANQEWELQVKSGSNVVHTFPRHTGSLSVDWDGKDLGGKALPEGKYRFVVRTTAKRDRVRDTDSVVLDVTPPTIEYKIIASKEYPLKGEIKLIVNDKLSGVDAKSIRIEQLKPPGPGEVGLDGDINGREEVVKPKLVKKVFDFLISILGSTENQAAQNGDFGLLQVIEPPPDEDKPNLTGHAFDLAGVPYQIALNTTSEVKLTGQCVSGNGFFKIHKIYDFDSRTVRADGSIDEKPDLTFVILPAGNSTEAAKQVNFAKHCIGCNSEVKSNPTTTNLNSNPPSTVGTKYNPQTGQIVETPRYDLINDPNRTRPIYSSTIPGVIQSYPLQNRQGADNLLIQTACIGNLGCGNGLGKDQSTFFTTTNTNILNSLGDAGQQIYAGLPKNYNSNNPVFILGADLDVALNLGYNPQLNINVNKFNRNNSINVKLIRDPKGYWKAQCNGANGNG